MISDNELQDKVEKIQNKLKVELFDEVILKVIHCLRKENMRYYLI